jgi:hypothetical protein
LQNLGNTTPLNFIADVDMSQSQGCAVIRTTTGDKTVAPAGANAASIIGILLNAPKAGEVAIVHTVPGVISLGMTGAAVTLSSGECPLETDSNGFFIPSATQGHYILAIAITATDAAGEFAEVTLLARPQYTHA